MDLPDLPDEYKLSWGQVKPGMIVYWAGTPPSSNPFARRIPAGTYIVDHSTGWGERVIYLMTKDGNLAGTVSTREINPNNTGFYSMSPEVYDTQVAMEIAKKFRQLGKVIPDEMKAHFPKLNEVEPLLDIIEAEAKAALEDTKITGLGQSAKAVAKNPASGKGRTRRATKKAKKTRGQKRL